MRRATRLLIAAGVATVTVVWALWAPWAPEGLNASVRSEPETMLVAVGGWLFQFMLVLTLINWIEDSV